MVIKPQISISSETQTSTLLQKLLSPRIEDTRTDRRFRPKEVSISYPRSVTVPRHKGVRTVCQSLHQEGSFRSFPGKIFLGSFLEELKVTGINE